MLRPSPWRLLVAWCVLTLCLGALLDRTYDIAVRRHETYAAAAESNRRLVVPLPAERGRILDRYGHVLALSEETWALKIIPANIRPNDPATARAAAVLGADLGQLERRIAELRRTTPNELRTLAGPLTDEQVARLTEDFGIEGQRSVASFQIGRSQARRYPQGPLLAGVIGYIGRVDETEHRALRDRGYRPDDVVGKAGVEAVYEEVLRGAPGVRVYERDARGRVTKLLEERLTVPGKDIRLTIDLALQQRIAAEVTPGIERGEYTAAGVVVEHPQNGQILALVSLPSYDNNLFLNGFSAEQWQRWISDPAKPLVSRVYGDHFPPGSTFKTAVGAAALEEGVATPQRVICSAGGIQYGNFYFRDWTAHGCINFADGLAHSSDVYFYVLAGGTPDGGRAGLHDRLPEYARAFGYGARTGIDLPGEAPGFIGDRAWKEAKTDEGWSRADEYFMGIGQGLVAVTPLQQVNFYSAVANGGYIERPHLLHAVVDPRTGAVQEHRPRFVREIPVAKEHLATLRAALRRVVSIGHAYMRTDLTVAGKTGTAEFGEVTEPGKPLPFHNWFVSFLPKGGRGDVLDTNAELAMAVFLYNTSAGCGDRPFCPNPAVSATERIYDWYMKEHLPGLPEGAPGR